MSLIALIRHGQTEWNRTGRIQGTSDIPLNETGRAQARAAGAELARWTEDEGISWDAVVASPLARAVETAAIVGAALGHEVTERVPALAERTYGEAEGLTGREIDARWGRGPVPGRETRTQVIERALPALLELGSRYGFVVAVTHGGVISSLVRHLTDWQLPRAGEFIRNGSIHLLEAVDGELVLQHYAGDAPPGLPPLVRA